MKAFRIMLVLVTIVILFLFSSCKENDPLTVEPIQQTDSLATIQKNNFEFNIYLGSYPYYTDQYIMAEKNDVGYLFRFQNDNFCSWVTFDITNVTTGLTLFHNTWYNVSPGVGLFKQLYLIPGDNYVCTCNSTSSGRWLGNIY